MQGTSREQRTKEKDGGNVISEKEGKKCFTAFESDGFPLRIIIFYE